MAIVYMFVFFVLNIGFGQTTTLSHSGCSYTFLVPKQENKACPTGSTESISNNEEIVNLKSTIRGLQEQMLALSQTVRHLQEKDATQGDIRNANNGSIGTNYVRWGRTSCPATAELIYQGKILLPLPILMLYLYSYVKPS